MDQELQVGKLPNELLEEIVISQIQNRRDEVLISSSVGEDTAVLDLGSDLAILSCDPITGAVKNIGKLGVHISVNDVSTKGAEPIGILLTLLMPKGTKKSHIEKIMEDVSQECGKLSIDIVGGHTEVTESVLQPILITTVIGKVKKENLPKPSSIEVGDVVCLTKYAGIEGTVILAEEKSEILENFLSKEELKSAQELISQVSVMDEGMTAAKYEIGYMHDVTEGGIEGALWEAFYNLDYGIAIEKDQIPVLPVTKKIGTHFGIDIYKLISSGSMLMIVKEKDFQLLKEELREKGILLSDIGKIVSEKEIYYFGDNPVKIDPPGSDELYKVIGKDV